ncbi:hypothetical protein OESDEN_18578 [Oesophagostomum dentatum]|uniref:Uncharacterized protein n=1 Tax=Oesophagostomum dentatum TaxID=61180 RepID=A0A0B1S9Y3_OESDE|nr:hypothetical protein OESDEN_18578 [Oesophagostomum dentatum]
MKQLSKQFRDGPGKGIRKVVVGVELLCSEKFVEEDLSLLGSSLALPHHQIEISLSAQGR